MASYFPFDLLGVMVGPTMLKLTSGYSSSENDFFLREQCLLAELETRAADNRLESDDLLL